MNYYERHLGDYAKDTAHLTMLEHGAYNLLLDRYYDKERGIPTDQIYRVTRARSKEERAAVDSVLHEFFELDGDVWINSRCDKEVIKAQAAINAARENGKRGGRPRKNPEPTQKEPTGLLPGYVLETQTKALQTPIPNPQSPEEDSRRGEDAPSVDKALYADARKIFGESIGGQVSKAIKFHGKPWLLGVIEACRSKDSEQARAYFAAAMNGSHKPDEAEKRRAIP